MEQIYTPKQEYKVLCNCSTYNQAKYIEDTLNGFAIQKTNFPFICVVIDDASTDNEQSVIEQWASIECDSAFAITAETSLYRLISAKHRSNKFCNFAFFLLKQNLWKNPKAKNELIEPFRRLSKYEAFCDGDDYWTQPLKLQIQADYLDSHKDISLVCHRFDVLQQRDHTIHTNPNPLFDKGKYSKYLRFSLSDNFLKFFYTWLLTTMVRIEDRDLDFVLSFEYCRDIHFVYDVLREKDGVCLNFNGAVYRLNQGSTYADNSQSEIHRIGQRVYQEFYDKAGSPVLKKVLAHQNRLVRMDESKIWNLFYRVQFRIQSLIR